MERTGRAMKSHNPSIERPPNSRLRRFSGAPLMSNVASTKNLP